MRKKIGEIALNLKSVEQLTEQDIISEQEKESQKLLDSLQRAEQELKPLHEAIARADEQGEQMQLKEEVNAQLRSIRRTSNNIRKAYHTSLSMGDELHARWEDRTLGRKRKFLPAPPANSSIDMEETQTDHFAQGLNIYKLILVCFIGCFAGVVIEMLWCLITRGYIESRAGLVYGPFNFLYGFGALTLTMALYKFRNRGRWISFLGGFAVGSVVEYFCSWLQELCFGSRSWDYSHMPFNLNGRICLEYSVFWGILGILWIKSIYPWQAKLILKIPNRVGKIMTWLILAFLIVDIVVTVVTVFRWTQRLEMIEASNAFWQFIDMRFPNERMQRIFANMKFGAY